MKFRSGADDFGGGLGIYDVSRPDRPRLISHWKTGTQGGGVHRYDFDGRYAYISPTAPGYIGNIVKILTCAIRRSPRKWGAGGFPASTRPAAKPIPGTTTCRRAATIRCAWATACTCRTGITACSSWTSRTWRARAWCRSSTPGRPIRIPRTRRCPYRVAQGRQILVVADEDVGCAVAAGLHLVLRHHGRAPAHADLHLPGRRRGP